MPKIGPFEKYAVRYDAWFERNHIAYESELRAVRSLLPPTGLGIEIGVGTGRFAAPLGIPIGIEPSPAMAIVARQRGIQVVQAVAEVLPFQDETFDFAIMVTTLCFLDDADIAFNEACRVLKYGGCLLVGFIDRESALGRAYQKHQNESPFYTEACFYSVQEVILLMQRAGLSEMGAAQTIFRDWLSMVKAPETVRPGYGEGAFVVLRAVKKRRAGPGNKRSVVPNS